MALSKNIQSKLDAIIAQYSTGDTVTLTCDQLVAAFASKAKLPATKRIRDPTKPKAPMSAFKRWKLNESSEIAAAIEAETGKKMAKRELNQHLAEMWEGMSEKDKSGYTIVAKIAEDDYKVQLKIWKSRNGVSLKKSYKKFDASAAPPTTVKGWSGPQEGFIEGSPVDPTTGKKFTKGFATIEEAIAKADELGANGITRTRVGFRVRIGKTVSCTEASRAKGECSWVRK